MSDESPMEAIRDLLMEVHAHSQATEKLALAIVKLIADDDPDFALKVSELLKPGNRLIDFPLKIQERIDTALEKIKEGLFVIHQSAQDQ